MKCGHCDTQFGNPTGTSFFHMASLCSIFGNYVKLPIEANDVYISCKENLSLGMPIYPPPSWSNQTSQYSEVSVVSLHCTPAAPSLPNAEMQNPSCLFVEFITFGCVLQQYLLLSASFELYLRYQMTCFSPMTYIFLTSCS